MSQKKWTESIKRNYKLLTRQLSSMEIERLIKSDAPSIFQFYARDMEKPAGKRNKVFRFLVLLKNLFKAFIAKFSTGRRIIYLVGLYVFAEGLLNGIGVLAFGGFLIVNVLLAAELADKLTAEDELEVARNIQLNLMPKHSPRLARFDIAFFNETAMEVGGDFYDFLQAPGNGGDAMVVIGDISGKGMAAALPMLQVHTLLHTLPRNGSLKNILCELNQKIALVFPPNLFLTMIAMRLAGDGSVRLCRAGHLPLIHYSSAKRTCLDLTPSGLAIGMAHTRNFDKNLDEMNLKPNTGDLLVLYSDGLVETRNAKKTEFGDGVLRQVVCEHAGKSSEGIRDEILKSVAQFRGTAPPHDDLTLIVVKVV
jgi:sigma-B regulation protein RsbU (phosphoserine phosphatase)